MPLFPILIRHWLCAIESNKMPLGLLSSVLLLLQSTQTRRFLFLRHRTPFLHDLKDTRGEIHGLQCLLNPHGVLSMMRGILVRMSFTRAHVMRLNRIMPYNEVTLLPWRRPYLNSGCARVALHCMKVGHHYSTPIFPKDESLLKLSIVFIPDRSHVYHNYLWIVVNKHLSLFGGFTRLSSISFSLGLVGDLVAFVII